MTKLEEIRDSVALDKESGHGYADYVTVGQIECLLAYVDAAEAFRKAYFCKESFGCNTKEQNEAWYQARLALGLG